MPKRHRKHRPRFRERLSVLAFTLKKAAAWIRQWLPKRWCIRVEVVIVDKPRREALQRQLTWGLRQLRRVLAEQPPTDIAVLVQHVIPLDRQLAGCCEVAHPA